MDKIRIAIVGLGKIARDQHVPALNANPDFELVAVASPHHRLEGVANFPSLEALLEAIPGLDAVALCTTPQARFELARLALQRGLAVFLEKPPGTTVSEARALAALAQRTGAVLFASWHSRFAPAVEPARAWLERRKILRAAVAWKEDVRVWHPGQAWIWKAGGLGVFDPGINALSILTRIIPGALALDDAELCYPRNCETPIAAALSLKEPGGAAIRVELDFRQTGLQSWDIEIDTESGQLRLAQGGSEMYVDGRRLDLGPDAEYPGLYAHFAGLVRDKLGDVDLAPFELVADAFLRGRRTETEPFIE
jgi:predicted dehydrogenase